MARTLRLVLIAVVVIVVAAVGGALAIGSQPVAEDVAVRVGSKTAGIFLNLRNNGLLPDCVVGV
ncbi:MAG: hypothetical protein QW263_02475, partial [Nitrososphaerota archaeon]